MWVRGLKLIVKSWRNFSMLSHPMWVRGLKLFVDDTPQAVLIVAPYVGAWIETCAASPPNLETLRRTLCGCVD